MPPTAVPFLYTAPELSHGRIDIRGVRSISVAPIQVNFPCIRSVTQIDRQSTEKKTGKQTHGKRIYLNVALLNHPRRFSTKYASDGTWKTRITNHEMPLCSEISADIAPETRQQSSHYYEASPSRFGKRPSQIEQLLTLFDQTKETLIPKSP